MRLIPQFGLGLVLAVSLGAALSACGDDTGGPIDFQFPVDYSVMHYDMAKQPTDGAPANDAQ